MPAYKGKKLEAISFPLGGIGTGSIGLAGNGRLIDWEIFNRPNKGSSNSYTHIAVKATQNNRIMDARVLSGDVTTNLSGQYGSGFGYGLSNHTMAGFPHFSAVSFDGKYPFAGLKFRDRNFPGKVTLTAFNPLIPLDEDNSSIPAAFFEIGFENNTDSEICYTAAFSLVNPFGASVNRKTENEKFSGVELLTESDKENGLALLTDSESSHTQLYWYRGGWQDGVSTFWREFSTEDEMPERSYDTSGGHDGCTVCASVKLAAGEKGSVRFVLSWYIPVCVNYWEPYKDEEGKDITWRNWYSTRWASAGDAASYALENYQSLYDRTKRFHDVLFSSSLDPVILDAIQGTVSVLKSAVVSRLEDGSLYGFEGAGEHHGSCEGSCTHVWSYTYACCFLFPRLERSLRENEYKYCQFEDGRIAFRMKLPQGRGLGWDMPCLDGQMAGVIKTYRDWKLSGDDEWLKEIFPYAQKALEFAWDEDSNVGWDKDRDGVLEGRQHHTLDVELFGPSAWLQGMYLAALKAAAEMASYLGLEEKAAEYLDIFAKGAKWTDENLFNGRYYIQKIDLNDKSILEKYGCADSYWNSEKGEIKYQIGDGCEIDQLLGQWHADICGLGQIFDPDNLDIALNSLYENNLKPSLREVTNMWRLFGINDEAGTLICEYPEGTYKPWIPIPYCEETMHGFEYALAGLFASRGYKKRAVEMVKAVRDRYDGKKRNPWNEIECGSNYARSMAVFAFIPILSGFAFDLPRRYIGFDPKVKGDFKCPWFTSAAWGEFKIKGKRAQITVLDGEIELAKVGLPKEPKTVRVNGTDVSFRYEDGAVIFEDPIIITGKLEAAY